MRSLQHGRFQQAQLRTHFAPFQHLQRALHERHGLVQIERRTPRLLFPRFALLTLFPCFARLTRFALFARLASFPRRRLRTTLFNRSLLAISARMLTVLPVASAVAAVVTAGSR